MHRWFHPNLNNVEAERLLLERGSDGSFLVRPSRSDAGQFSLSVRRRDKVTHIKIRHAGDFYDLCGGEKFATLDELIQYYQENQLKEKGKDGEIFELRKPLNSSDPTTERWFHGSMSGRIAERLIRDKGVNGSFLVRESQSKLGDYVLTVRTRDESSQSDKVTHVIIRHHNNKYDVGGGERFDSLTELVEHYKRNPMVETTGTVVNMKYPFNATRITASDIDIRVRELSKENLESDVKKEGFWEEFEHLQHQECKVLFDRKVGQQERNLSKNRYKNILPYDYTRVILRKPITSFKNEDNNPSATEIGQSLTNSNHRKFSSSAPRSASSSGFPTSNLASCSVNSDYINANYIKLVEDDTIISPRSKTVPHSKTYIATQGPLPNTTDDFWWMVWQEKSDCIVMVTKEVERGKTKCFRYWPTLEQKVMICGSIEVRLISDTSMINNCDNIMSNSTNRVHPSQHSTTPLPQSHLNNSEGITREGSELKSLANDFVVREFELAYRGGDENNDCLVSRRVRQYQYLAWPDQNIPINPASVLYFLQVINSRPLTGNMIVHCSAGIGRSGTLIVIDMLIDQLNHHGQSYEIDIQRIVKVARAQRSGLVQTEAQYKFIYIAIQEYILSFKQTAS